MVKHWVELELDGVTLSKLVKVPANEPNCENWVRQMFESFGHDVGTVTVLD